MERRGALGLILCLLCLFPGTALAGPYADLQAQLQAHPQRDPREALENLADGDTDAAPALEDGSAAAARSYIALRATLEGDDNAKPPAIAVKRGEERIASSWLARAMDRLRLPKIDLPKQRVGGGGAGIFGPWVTTVMWVLLALLGCFAAYMLFRYVRFAPRSRDKALAPDEPLRSADAWLEEANALIGQGRYREAVRGLYVAGLMRFDEAGVARFDRNQTNWEHLRRIEASPKRPEASDVRGATGRFDRCWYGHLPTTMEDATAMRSWYDQLVAALASPPPSEAKS